jgi:hypothetical protein
VKFRSQVYTAVSGSVGGVTYAHNAGGMYARGRATPTNTNTEFQQEVRNNFGSLSQRWGNVLTAEQRQAWRDYASATPITNVFGEPLVLSGQQMYLRCNSVRLQVGEAVADNGPTTPGLATLSPIVVTTVDDVSDIYYTIVNTNNWAIGTAGALAIYISRPQPAGVESFNGPYRLATTLAGAVSPPSNSQTQGIDTFPLSVGQRVWMRFVATDQQGRLSATQNLGPFTVEAG